MLNFQGANWIKVFQFGGPQIESHFDTLVENFDKVKITPCDKISNHRNVFEGTFGLVDN